MTKNEHVAAVKALAWSPHKHNILATGGGTADKSIRMWNTTTYEEILKYDTGSQVCNLFVHFVKIQSFRHVFGTYSLPGPVGELKTHRDSPTLQSVPLLGMATSLVGALLFTVCRAPPWGHLQ